MINIKTDRVLPDGTVRVAPIIPVKGITDKLFEGLAEAALDDPQMAREILEDAGMDPNKIAEEGQDFVDGLKSNSS